MKNICVKLEKGILGEYHQKVKNTLVYKIDANDHINTYIGEKPRTCAEPEFSGKYIDLCVSIHERYGDKTALEHAKLVVYSAINNMRPDGYMGTLEKGNEFEVFSVWNQTFTVFGMLSYYRATKDQKVLSACEKCISYVMEYFYSDGHDILDCVNLGTQHPSILLVLSDMYKFTKKDIYIKYIEHILDRFKNSDLNLLEFDSILELRSRKGIEIFVILLGILKYAELTGDAKAIDSVKKYWQEVNDTQIRNTGNGTIGESWTENGNAPAILTKELKASETCVAVGWIEISLSLFKITKDVRYINAIDRTLYNHILASISEEGDDFAYYQPNCGKKIRTSDVTQYKCCRYRGFTLFTYMPDMLFLEDEESLIPMIYTNCEYISDSVKISEKTNYPFEGDIHFSIDVCNDKLLKLRIPIGYDVSHLKVNKQDEQLIVEEGYIIIPLKADNHYDIDLLLAPKTKIERANIDGTEFASITYGTVLLALYDKDNDVVINIEQLHLSRKNDIIKGYTIFSGEGIKNKNKAKVIFTDYASADDYKVWFPVTGK